MIIITIIIITVIKKFTEQKSKHEAPLEWKNRKGNK